MTVNSIPTSDRTRVRRAPKRGHYDRDTVNAILDSGHIAHIGYLHDGAPIVTPMLYWRDGDFLYWHGSTASRAMKATINAAVCLTVTHLDGLVLAKSAFHHSANYRSVMLFGEGEIVADPAEKTASLKLFMDQQFPHRWETLRPVNDQELKATLIGRMAIGECAAKVRTGPPNDHEDDQDWAVWTGILPLRHIFGEPISDPLLAERDKVPEGVSQHVGRLI